VEPPRTTVSLLKQKACRSTKVGTTHARSSRRAMNRGRCSHAIVEGMVSYGAVGGGKGAYTGGSGRKGSEGKGQRVRSYRALGGTSKEKGE
jgi:hypothetical protein